MKRVTLAVSSAAIAVLALLPGTVAQAAASGGYTVSRITLTSRVFGIAVDPSTGLVYVGGYGPVRGQGAVTVIDGAGQAVGQPIPVPGIPLDLAVDPATDTIYAATYSNGLAVIDGKTDKVITTIPVASDGKVAVDPATNTVYATAMLPGNVRGVEVIDGATDSVTPIPMPGAAAIGSLTVDAATDTVYAGTQNGILYAISGASNQVAKSVQLGLYTHLTGLAVDSATNSLYAAFGGNTVDVFNAQTLAASTPITGCAYHVVAAAADPATNTVFVTSYGSGSPNPADSTCVIDAATNTVTDTFPRGGMDVAADPVTGAAYIAAWNPLNDVWVATPSATNELSPVDYGFGPSSLGSPSATFAVGRQSSFPLKVSALPAAMLTETGALPAGVTMSPAGVFSGTPAAGTLGTYPITVTAANGVSPADTVALTIVVDIAPAITSPPSATFQTGVPGSFTVQATGTPAPEVYAVYPSWLTFTGGTSTGVLSGTPPPGSGGVWEAYVWADNGSGFTASQTIALTVNQPPAIVSASRLVFRVRRFVRYRIRSTGYPAAVLRERGPLPLGLRFRQRPGGTALIIGRPAPSDRYRRYRIIIIAVNRAGRARKAVLIIIR